MCHVSTSRTRLALPMDLGRATVPVARLGLAFREQSEHFELRSPELQLAAINAISIAPAIRTADVPRQAPWVTEHVPLELVSQLWVLCPWSPVRTGPLPARRPP